MIRMFSPLFLCALTAGPAMAEGRLNVLSWGGDFAQAQDVAMARPFEAETGIGVNFIDSDDPQGVVKLQVEARNVTADLASVGQGAAQRLCEEGDAEPLDLSALAPAADGQPAATDFLPGGLGDCFVATDIYSTVIAYDHARLGASPPQKVADFFDLKRFPGRRGLPRTPQFTLELALLGDGVPAADVYKQLATPEGLDRAFAKLDTIRAQVVWWGAGAQPVQLLADGEVAMTLAYNGRVFKAAKVDHKPLSILWDGQIYEIEGWVIPKGAPRADDARKFLTYSTRPAVLAHFAEQLPYGPPRRSAQGMVGAFAGDGTTQMAPHLPTAPENMTNALFADPEFWAANETQLRERFAAWLGKS